MHEWIEAGAVNEVCKLRIVRDLKKFFLQAQYQPKAVGLIPRPALVMQGTLIEVPRVFDSTFLVSRQITRILNHPEMELGQWW